MTVYADILLLVNFSMDFLTLYLTGRLLNKAIRKSYMIAAALFGSAGGTVYSLAIETDGICGTILSVAAGLALSAVMARISFGRYTSKLSLLRESLSIWGAGTLLGGIMTFLLSLGEPVYSRTDSKFLPAFAACFIVSVGAIRLFSASKSKKSAVVCVRSAGISHTFEALCDSGSFASEPISGLPVIIVRKTALADLYEMLRADPCPLKLRMIPLNGIGGECLLRGFLPDSVTVDNKEVRAVVAVREDSAAFAGYDGIIPAAICSGR